MEHPERDADEGLSGLPNDFESQPMGPDEPDPDGDAPPPDDLPGLVEPGIEPPTDG
jgi:hypothetical protein